MNTHCMGSYSVRINDWSRNLVKNILSEDRFKHYIDKKKFRKHKN